MAAASPHAKPDMEQEQEDPAFVIKNLDTGLEMRIDDFDRLANIAVDEPQEQQQEQKKGGLMKGTKALKHWCAPRSAAPARAAAAAAGRPIAVAHPARAAAPPPCCRTAATAKKASATAKKAVTGIKEAAHDINLQAHPRRARGSAVGAGPSAGAGAELLLRRSTTAESAAQPESEPGLASSSLASVSVSSGGEHGGDGYAQPGGAALPAAVVAAPSAGHHRHVPGASAPSATSGTASAPSLTPHASLLPAPGAGAGAAGCAAAAAAAAAGLVGPPVPAAVRLVSHKRSGRAIDEVVLAQVLEGSCGVVWALAFSRDGSFLAAGGQDGVLRVWQLTASRDKEPRTNWVYAPPAPPPAEPRRSSDAHSEQLEEEGSSPSHRRGEQPQQPQQPQQPLPPSPPQQQQEQQQQQHAQQEQHAGGDTPSPSGGSSSHASPSPGPEQPGGAGGAAAAQQPPHVAWGPYLSLAPVRSYAGHGEDILDVSWSGAGFVLTASLDKSARLWHVSQPGCLRTFWHSDFVTSVQFHPGDAQRFVSGARVAPPPARRPACPRAAAPAPRRAALAHALTPRAAAPHVAGSIDGKIRVWSIPQNAVLATASLHQDMVTAVAFSLSGTRVLAGTMRGRVRFYELAARKLEYVAQVDVRNTRGQHASGRKVTGIRAVPGHPAQFLITTNDSRLRLLEGYGQVLKFKGHRNSSTQSRAALSADGAAVVCGSDDGWAYLRQLLQGGKNQAHQAFLASDAGAPVTACAFAPPGALGPAPRSVLAGTPGSGGTTAGGAAEGGEASDGAASGAASRAGSRPGLGGRPVQQLLVTAGFAGAVRVHELL
ncbi:SPAC3H5.08c [Scenedesmus sp. PABB004]|nr:SPAC3H5.08c [Scenedesmus sp. PABB004]